jgi:hypothetical protein
VSHSRCAGRCVDAAFDRQVNNAAMYASSEAACIVAMVPRCQRGCRQLKAPRLSAFRPHQRARSATHSLSSMDLRCKWHISEGPHRGSLAPAHVDVKEALLLMGARVCPKSSRFHIATGASILLLISSQDSAPAEKGAAVCACPVGNPVLLSESVLLSVVHILCTAPRAPAQHACVCAQVLFVRI